MIHAGEHEYAWAPRGAVDIETPAGVLRADAHWAVWIPESMPHAVRPVDDSAILLPVFFPSATCVDWFGEPTVLARDAAMDRRATRAGQPGIHGLRTARREALALHAGIGATRQSRLRAADGVVIPAHEPARTVALALLREPERTEQLAQWAQIVHVSARTLQRSFTAQTGQSFGAWRTRLRVRSGLPLLREGATVAQAAIEVGFASPSAFSAACRAETGSTPGRWRSEALREGAVG
jgi:AraC-like DNA-binding protein